MSFFGNTADVSEAANEGLRPTAAGVIMTAMARTSPLKFASITGDMRPADPR